MADALGYTNPKSATNRWNALKRSNGFKVDATSGRPVVNISMTHFHHNINIEQGASPSKGSPSKVTKSKRPGKSIPKPTADEGKPGKRLTSDKENQGAGPEEN